MRGSCERNDLFRITVGYSDTGMSARAKQTCLVRPIGMTPVMGARTMVVLGGALSGA